MLIFQVLSVLYPDVDLGKMARADTPAGCMKQLKQQSWQSNLLNSSRKVGNLKQLKQQPWQQPLVDRTNSQAHSDATTVNRSSDSDNALSAQHASSIADPAAHEEPAAVAAAASGSHLLLETPSTVDQLAVLVTAATTAATKAVADSLLHLGCRPLSTLEPAAGGIRPSQEAPASTAGQLQHHQQQHHLQQQQQQQGIGSQHCHQNVLRDEDDSLCEQYKHRRLLPEQCLLKYAACYQHHQSTSAAPCPLQELLPVLPLQAPGTVVKGPAAMAAKLPLAVEPQLEAPEGNVVAVFPRFTDLQGGRQQQQQEQEQEQQQADAAEVHEGLSHAHLEANQQQDKSPQPLLQAAPEVESAQQPVAKSPHRQEPHQWESQPHHTLSANQQKSDQQISIGLRQGSSKRQKRKARGSLLAHSTPPAMPPAFGVGEGSVEAMAAIVALSQASEHQGAAPPAAAQPEVVGGGAGAQLAQQAVATAAATAAVHSAQSEQAALTKLGSVYQHCQSSLLSEQQLLKPQLLQQQHQAQQVALPDKPPSDAAEVTHWLQLPMAHQEQPQEQQQQQQQQPPPRPVEADLRPGGRIQPEVLGPVQLPPELREALQRTMHQLQAPLAHTASVAVNRPPEASWQQQQGTKTDW
jgi:hypothetical protein